MGSYSDRLNSRMGLKNKRSRLRTPHLDFTSRMVKDQPMTDPDEPAIVVPSHPRKYPDHYGSKGSVFGGVCNTTRCDRRNATFYNIMTFGYYCGVCADGINYQKNKMPICIPVNSDLTHDQMDIHYQGYVF